MKKMKKLLVALLMGTACASVFAFVGCAESGNNDEGDLPDESIDITEEDVPLGGYVCEHDGASHVSAVSAGCETAGNKEYWYCSSCNTYFSDEDCTVETSLAAVTLTKLGHGYGEFVYDYEAKQYVKVCENDETHKVEQPAGTAEYPYLANDEENLKSAVANGGYVKLIEDVVLTSVLNIDNTVNIDLNDYNISNSESLAQFIKVAGNNNLTLTISNGELNNLYTGTTSTYVINVSASDSTDSAPHVILNGVSINNTSKGLVDDKYSSSSTRTHSIYLGDAAHITLTDCELNYGYYGINYKKNTVVEINGGSINNTFSCLQGNGSEHNTVVTVNNVNIETYYGIYHPQYGVLNITGGSVAAVGTALEVRAGTATIKNVNLSSTYEFTSSTGDGISTSGCAIAVSQHSTDREINVTVEGCTLTGVYAIYEKDFKNNTARDLISITLGEGNTYNGSIYSENCENLAEVA